LKATASLTECPNISHNNTTPAPEERRQKGHNMTTAFEAAKKDARRRIITVVAQKAAEAYNTAKTTTDDQEKKEARETFRKIEADVNAAGGMYKTVFSLIFHQIRTGNAYVDISEPFMYSGHEEELINAFREYGIFYFSFSSQWSNAGRSAYAFKQMGATVENLIEVYTGQETYDGQKEKAPAYIFRVN